MGRELLERFAAYERLSAMKLNSIVELLNRQGRDLFHSADAADWIECLAQVDAPPFSILAATEYEDFPPADGRLFLNVVDVTEESLVLVANEDYPLKAGEKGWVKLINPARACRVRVVYEDFAPTGITFLEDVAVLDQAISDIGFYTGTGTGSGSSGTAVRPLGALWSISRISEEGHVWIMGSRGGNVHAGFFVLKDTSGIVTGGDVDALVTCYKLDKNLTSWDTEVEYELNLGAVDGIIFPPVVGQLAPHSIISAVMIDDVWLGIDGGITGFYAPRSSGGITVFGHEVPCSIWCGATIPNGADTLSILANGNSVFILGDCCTLPETGTGSGS